MRYLGMHVTVEGAGDDVTLEVVADETGIVRVSRVGALYNHALMVERLATGRDRDPGVWVDHQWVPLRWLARLGGINFECGLDRLARESQRRNLGS